MIENTRLAFQGILAHKMRSFLTMLGVIIGIASIIAIVSTIKGTNDLIMKNLVGAGNNNVNVTLRQGDSDYYMESGLPQGVRQVSEEQKQAIRDMDKVYDASFYMMRTYVDRVANGKHVLNSGRIYGVDSHYLDTVGYEVYRGRPFVDRDYEKSLKVLLLDENASSQLFPDEDPLGKIVEIRSEPFLVAGLIRKQNASKPVIQSLQDYETYASDDAGILLIPDVDWPILYQYDEPENCVARAKKTEDMSDVGRDVAQIMNQSVSGYTGEGFAGSTEEAEEEAPEAENLMEGEGAVSEAGMDGGPASSAAVVYKAEDLLETARNRQQLAQSTNNLLLWVAAVSLVVGGIGVMNIMLVSVTERTSEIGLKKALGARKNRILTQFLTESAVLTSLGGILGVIAGIILSWVISRMSGTPVAISIPIIIGAVVFSMAVGILFGLLPSVKAANLEPIEALRRE